MIPAIKFDMVAEKKNYLKQNKINKDDYDLELFLL